MARKLVIVEGELERTEERAELAEAWVSTPGNPQSPDQWSEEPNLDLVLISLLMVGFDT